MMPMSHVGNSQLVKTDNREWSRRLLVVICIGKKDDRYNKRPRSKCDEFIYKRRIINNEGGGGVHRVWTRMSSKTR